MNDDPAAQPDVEALLQRHPEESGPPVTEAELDAEFDAIMTLLDNLDEEQAAELDDVAARARNGLGSPDRGATA